MSEQAGHEAGREVCPQCGSADRNVKIATGCMPTEGGAHPWHDVVSAKESNEQYKEFRSVPKVRQHDSVGERSQRPHNRGTEPFESAPLSGGEDALTQHGRNFGAVGASQESMPNVASAHIVKPFVTARPCSYQEHCERIKIMLAEGLHDGTAWKPEAHTRYAELETSGHDVVSRSQPETPQWWLVELDRYGNCVRMVDGAHSSAAGANKAAYLIKAMHLSSENCTFAVAEIHLHPCEPSSEGVNHDAVNQINTAAGRTQGREEK
jgi:hypothetical protein